MIKQALERLISAFRKKEVPDDRQVSCAAHGMQPLTLACQHVAMSLISREAVGFWWSQESDQEYPEALCSACNERTMLPGFKWEGADLEQFGFKILCAGCYREARELALGS